MKLRSTEILSVAGLAYGSLAQDKPLAVPPLSGLPTIAVMPLPGCRLKVPPFDSSRSRRRWLGQRRISQPTGHLGALLGHQGRSGTSGRGVHGDRSAKRCLAENVTLFYAPEGSMQCGALIEIGAALASGRYVFIVSDYEWSVLLKPRSRPIVAMQAGERARHHEKTSPPTCRNASAKHPCSKPRVKEIAGPACGRVGSGRLPGHTDAVPASQLMRLQPMTSVNETGERTTKQGTVKYFFHLAHNFGFIKSDAGSDIFVHSRQVIGGTVLVVGQRVEFEQDLTSQIRGRPVACNVRVIDGAAAQPRQPV